jgi:hypothetical protein
MLPYSVHFPASKVVIKDHIKKVIHKKFFLKLHKIEYFSLSLHACIFPYS